MPATSSEAVPVNGANGTRPPAKGRHTELAIYAFSVPLATQNMD